MEKVILNIKDQSRLGFLMELLGQFDFVEIEQKSGDSDFWDELDEDVKASIDRGLQSIADGKTKTHEEVMAATKEKYPHLFK